MEPHEFRSRIVGISTRTFPPWLSSRLFLSQAYVDVHPFIYSFPGQLYGWQAHAPFISRTTCQEGEREWGEGGGWKSGGGGPFLGNVSFRCVYIIAAAARARVLSIHSVYVPSSCTETLLFPGSSPFASYLIHVLPNTPSEINRNRRCQGETIVLHGAM